MTRRTVLMMVAVVCMALALGSLGCGNNAKGNPEQTVEDYWTALEQGNIEKSKTYLSKTTDPELLESMTVPDDPTSAAMMETFLSAFSIQVIDSTVNGNNATVNVKMTGPDMDYVLEELFSSIGDLAFDMTEESASKMADEAEKLVKEAPVSEIEVPISLVWEDNAWKIVGSPLSGMMGGS
jgi:hypothetical protein